jgi:hypothetical protein
MALRVLLLLGFALLLTACRSGLPAGMQDRSGALVVTGWDGLDHEALRFFVTGTARDSVLALLQRHSDSTGVPLSDYLVETHLKLLKRAAEQIAEYEAAGRDSFVVTQPIGYHSLIIELSAAADSVIYAWPYHWYHPQGGV